MSGEEREGLEEAMRQAGVMRVGGVPVVVDAHAAEGMPGMGVRVSVRCSRHKAVKGKPSGLCGKMCREEWGS